MAPSTSRNRTIRLDGEVCIQARRALGLSRETLSARATGPHPLSVATIRRAEAGQSIYLETARRLAEILALPLSALAEVGTSAQRETLDLKPPAVSVLPFRWLGPDADGSHLASGLTEDLLVRLSHFWFPVVSPYAFQRHDGAPADPAQHVADLKVRYWIDGSVRRSGDVARVVAHLVQSDDGRILWTQTFERDVKDVLKFQEELAASIVSELGSALIDVEARRARELPETRQSAWELSLLGAWHFQRQNKLGNTKARTLLEEALRQEPGLPLAWYTLAMTHRLDIINRWTSNLADSLRALHQTGTRYTELHPRDPGHHVVAAYVHVLIGQREGAKPRLEEALSLDPNHSTAYSVLGQALAFNGHGDEAIEHFEMALRLRPISVENWQPLIGMALSHFVQERYEDTLDWTRQACRIRPDMPIPLATRAAAFAYLQDHHGAAEAVTELRKIDPGITIGSFQALARSASPELANRFFNGLRLAGLSD